MTELLASVGLAVVAGICLILLIVGLTAALKRLGLSSSRIGGKAFAAIGAWLLLTAILAQSGFLSNWTDRPPRLPLVPLSALASLICLNRTPFFKRILGVTPRYWPIALQTFRIGVELSFWGFYLAGRAPVQVTFEGRNFDVLVGLTAPLIALAIYKNKLAPRAVIAWNVAGLAVLLNTIVTVFSSVPGPLHLNWPGQPFNELASWPLIWIPGFLAPLAIFLHIFSIRQNAALIEKTKEKWRSAAQVVPDQAVGALRAESTSTPLSLPRT